MTTHEFGEDGNEQAWEVVCQDYIEITDEVVQLRLAAIEQYFSDNGLDMQLIFKPDDDTEGDFRNHESVIFAAFEENLQRKESGLATRLMKVEPEHSFMLIRTPGEYYAADPCVIDGEVVLRHAVHRLDGNRLKRVTFNTPLDLDEEQSRQLADMLNEAVEDQQLSWEELSLSAAQGLVRALKVYRRYIGELLYDRESLPSDPA